MQPRYSGRWWVDQDGDEWSAFDLWRGGISHSLTRLLSNDDDGVRVYRTVDGDLLHLVRIPPPDAPETKKCEFYDEWEEQGRPPAR